jgi:hypothetical protein
VIDKTALSLALDLNDQFAFRPTGSTTAAIIAILQALSDYIANEPYVHFISLDFSKAFDTVRHCTLFEKIARIPIPDHIYNWAISFFSDRQHITVFNGHRSVPLPINSSVVQGSAFGPVSFIINASDLHPVSKPNRMFKYADDTYILVPASNAHTIQLELSHIARWSNTNNLKLNLSKTRELIVHKKGCKLSKVDPTAGIERVDSLKILGVTIDSTLGVQQYVSNIMASANQTLYALKILKHLGLKTVALYNVNRSVLIPKLAYASPAWHGFLCANDSGRLQSIINKSVRWGLSGGIALPTFSDVSQQADNNLFQSIIGNASHILRHLLPPVKMHTYSLRQRAHNFTLPKLHPLSKRNFLSRMIFKDIY